MLQMFFFQIMSLSFKVKGILYMNITRGQYKEGQNVTLNCEVPRVKGNISTDNLRVFLGKSKLPGSSIIKTNLDTTKTLFFNQVFSMTSEYHNKRVSCVFFSPHGEVQNQSALLQIMSCMYFKYLN